MRPTVALVHKDETLRICLRISFELECLQVVDFADGKPALDWLSQNPAQLGIFGRRMPTLDGPDLFRRLKGLTTMPIIFLSSLGADLADEVPGADDYLDAAHALVAVDRGKRLLRRHGHIPQRTALVLRLDPASRACFWCGTQVHLNLPEYLMLEAMADRGIHTRFSLMEAAYGAEIEMDEKVVETHLAGLRRKFHAVDPQTQIFEPVAGVAYRLSKPLKVVGLPL